MKSIPVSLGLSVRLATLACALSLIGACAGNGPPEGFEPVAAATLQPGQQVCPDLSGTFDLAGTSLATEIAGRQPPNTHGLPVLMTFQPGPMTLEGWWVVPRKRLVAFATAMSEDAPKRYARWRGLVLKDPLAENLRQNPDAYLAAVAELGPPGPTYALVVNQGCQDNWMRVGSATEQVPANDGSTRSQEREVWLARDASGALLVKRITYTLKHYSLWAPSTQSIRTSRSTTFERIAQADPESAAPLVATDLPADPQTQPRALMACVDVPAHVAAFSQRLKSLLPPKVDVTRFELNPVRQRDADGNCPYAVVDVEIVGGDAYFLSRTRDWIKAETNVDSVETLRIEPAQRRANTLRLRVVLR